VSDHATHPTTPFTDHGTPAHATTHAGHDAGQDPEHDHAHQFDDAVQQYDATTLGMWAFLATEVLFFGGVFCAYIIYRGEFYDGYFIGSHFLNKWVGFANTGVLLCSSFTAAMCVRAAHMKQRKTSMNWLFLTAILGSAFVALKLMFEYTHEWHLGLVPLPVAWDPNIWIAEAIRLKVPGVTSMESVTPVVQNQVRMFFLFYFIMTMIHALHMVIGVGVMLMMVIRARFGTFAVEKTNMPEMVGLYWHFVDIVWIFLFPLLYLIR